MPEAHVPMSMLRQEREKLNAQARAALEVERKRAWEEVEEE